MLPDSDPQKWEYDPHTAAKHRILSKYLKAWLAILARSAHSAGRRAELVIVDAFAGRGRYTGGEPGSPLILYSIARDAISSGIADEVELFLVEKDPANHSSLVQAVSGLAPFPGIVVRGPQLAEFAQAGPAIVREIQARRRPAFWFVDPFGFSGVPLAAIRSILAQPQWEAFITFMARDVNRFLDEKNHRVAISELLELSGAELDAAVNRVQASPNLRVQALRDLYQSRLRAAAGAKYVWPFRVASSSAAATVYYLVHASTHPKAFREMKDATFEEGGSRYAFLGKEDFAITGQMELPMFEDDMVSLKDRLQRAFAGQEIAFDPPGESDRNFLNEVYPDPQFHPWIEQHFRRAVNEMVSEGRAHKTAVTSATRRGLQGLDRIQFLAEKQPSMF